MPSFVFADGLHQRRLQRRSKLRGAGRRERDGLYLRHPRAGLPRATLLLLVEQRQAARPHAATQQR